MRELSIEEKAKAYDEAIKRAQAKMEEAKVFDYDDEQTAHTIRLTTTDIFPELKESEDERIREKVIATIHLYYGEPLEDEAKEMIAWLEKQPTPQVRTGLEWVNTIDDACDKRYSEEYAHGEYCHEQSFKWGFQEGVDWFEKQDEQKPADKVEPRFKVGDWITNGIDVYKIKNIDLNEFNYIFENGISDISLVDNICHLWTIQDAKDGDVLVASDGSIFLFKGTIECACKHYVALTTDGAVKFNEGLEHYWETSTAVHPAAKEQRDQLEKAMADAGYTFDFESKELKKIEPKPSWGVEDEDYFDAIITKLEITQEDAALTDNQMEFLKSIKDRVQPKQEWSEENKAMLNKLLAVVDLYYDRSGNDLDKQSCISWLKSLRPHSQWKPSDEQMDALEKECIAHSNYELCRLLEQLKKLRDE